ncbi:MAG: YicC/YloC family endoribonuclease [Rhodothermales bacterium]
MESHSLPDCQRGPAFLCSRAPTIPAQLYNISRENAMIDSMTGFGRGQAEVGSATATVELRSVNNRFCEISIRLPRNVAEHEAEIQNRVKKAFSRGRINVQIQVETTSEQTLPIEVNREAARNYADLLNQLREAAGIEEPLRIEHLLNYSDIFTTHETPDQAAAEMWKAVEIALDQAIVEMRQMRRQEGSALLADLEARIDAIGNQLGRVQERAPARVAEARERLRSRVYDLLQEERIDGERLELEIALLADRLDITEECVRLRSHLELFRQALNSENPEGRKLNFISQEINREVNTIGSKANDAEIAHIAVDMKDELEKIREQVQNVE